MRKSTSLNIQKGVSLISLMIGLLISMMVTLACMVVYKNLIYVSTDNKVYAGFDGRISLAGLVLEKSIQSAGFGIADASEDDIKIIQNGTTQQLYWRYSNLDGSAYFCEGFEEITVADSGGVNYRELRMMNAAACDESTELTTMTWTVNNLLARWRLGDDQVAQYIKDNNRLFNFNLSEGECTSFGRSLADDTGEHYILKLSAPDAAYLFNPAVPVTEMDICLYNFHPEAS
ncbi:MAG: hypothetical protein CMI13_00265 [Oleibacter sp.]|nr:hypothetical protein [Thalassolituus sp.]|tara:strand:- start:1821 stop:2513 length:693 start_codon:yes stop_codon:yes gene_type:complete